MGHRPAGRALLSAGGAAAVLVAVGAEAHLAEGPHTSPPQTALLQPHGLLVGPPLMPIRKQSGAGMAWMAWMV